MRILFYGNKNRAIQCLKALTNRDHEIVGVVAPPDSTIKDWYPSLPVFASERDLDVYQPADVNSSSFVSAVADMAPDLGVMAGYNQILGSQLLSIPDEGVINLHGGKLPAYRGASTLNWMIIEGEIEGGISILFADEGIDTGDIIRQTTFQIKPNDTIVDVIETTDKLFPPMLLEAIEQIAQGTVDPTPQTPTGGTHYHSRRPRDGRIHWRHHTAEDVYNLVRALAGPYPGAFTTFDGEKLVIHEASLIDRTVAGQPGRVCLRDGQGVLVVAANRGIRIETVEPASGPSQDATDFFDSVGCDLGNTTD